MAPEQRKLVTIVTESVIEIDLCEALTDLGASGYTVTNARGSGSRGIRNAGWSSNSNIRIEVVCDEPVATRIAEHLREHYYAEIGRAHV